MNRTLRSTTPLALMALAIACAPSADDVRGAALGAGGAAIPTGGSSSGGGSGGGPDGSYGPLTASISDDGQRVVLAFPLEVSDVRPTDFKLLGTHAKIDESKAPDVGGSSITLWLDEAVYPDDPLELDYFAPSGTLRAPSDGRRIDSFRIPVVNTDTKYRGDREVVLLESDQNISAAMKPNTLIVLMRGERYRGSFEVNDPNVAITGSGQGDPPVLQGDDSAPTVSIFADGFRMANLRVEANDRAGIAFRGSASFGFVSSSTIHGNGDPGRKAIFLHRRTSRDVNAWPEGHWALNNTITGFEDGIISKLESNNLTPGEEGHVVWHERELGGDHTPMLVELNTVRCAPLGGAEGDGIALARGGYFGSKVRRNTVVSWGDDGIDNFGARNVIVEYNVLHNQADHVNPRGSGSGIKMGGEGTGRGNDDRAGNNIYRYNAILGTIRERGNAYDPANGYGLIAFRGPNPIGMSQVYGNVVVGTAGHALMLDGSDGSVWQVYNNLFIADGPNGEGIKDYQAFNLDQLDLRNNVYSSVNFSLSNSNLRATNLETIYIDAASPNLSLVRYDSPTVDAGEGEGAERDLVGSTIERLDIGPTEYVTSRDMQFIQLRPTDTAP